MRYWMIDKSATKGDISCARAAALLSAVGRADPKALASEILDTVDGVLPACQCTVFAYESGNRPRVVSVGDRRGGSFLSDVADTYIRLFYTLDGNQRVLADASVQRSASAIVMQRQRRDDILHDGYRNSCYDRPAVGDRLALLQRTEEGVWLSVNLYKGQGQGEFRDSEIHAVQALAPLVAHATRLHYTLVAQHRQGVPHLMLARLRAHCPELSKRELDVLGGILEGRTALEIADTMGIRPSSVVTYQKRAYRRLGISSQRELFSLTLTPRHVG